MTVQKHNTIVLVVSVLICAGLFVFANKKQKPTVKAQCFFAASGWGYDILVNDKLLIHQVSVPALKGDRGFATKEQAEQAASLIINKIENGQEPTLTTFDLRKIVPEYTVNDK